MKYLDSVPHAMIEKINKAREFTEQEKARALANGRPYSPIGLIFMEESDVALFEKLASHPDMDSAWCALRTVFDDGKPEPDTWAFAGVCSAICKAWEASPKRTPAEHRDFFNKLADDIVSVAVRVISEPEFGTMGRLAAPVSPVEMVSDEEVAWLIDRIDATREVDYVASADEISHARSCLLDVMPQLYRYAEWISAHARGIAEQSSISARPHCTTAARTFFVRHLSNWFERKHGRRMHVVVACVAAAIFDEPVATDTVRGAVACQPKDLPLYRPRKLPSHT